MSNTNFCWDGCKRTTTPFLTITGVKVCSYCGEKYPTEFRRADKIEEHEVRLNYLQERIKRLEDRP